jgi:hypothetical protein
MASQPRRTTSTFAIRIQFIVLGLDESLFHFYNGLATCRLGITAQDLLQPTKRFLSETESNQISRVCFRLNYIYAQRGNILQAPKTP